MNPTPTAVGTARTLGRFSAHVPAPCTLAVALILVSAIAPLLYVWAGHSLTLSADEAHYWDWSRHLDWSYYSKGPLVAWLIRASCEVFGPLSVALTGDLAAAVRTPAAVCHAALLAGWYVLASGVFRSPRMGLAVVAGAAALPFVRAGAVLMTIDPPFMACWCWSLVCVWKALDTRRTGWWAGAAAATAFGILAKYTMALFPATVVAYLLFHRRAEFRRPGVWLLLAGATVAWVPVLAWNASHDWVSFRHVFRQVGVEGSSSSGIRWDGVAKFASGQFVVMFGLWLPAFLAAAWRFRPTRETDPGVRLLWWVSVPVWFLFAGASFVKPGQANWPAPVYIGGFVLALAWVGERFSHRPRLVGACVAGTILLGLAASAMLHFPDLVRPTFARITPPPTASEPFPARRYDMTARISGWNQLAGEVDAIRERLRAETGADPVIAATHWSVPGSLGCYCAGHPDVYALGVANHSDRYSQYDLWRPNPTADAQVFRGRSFVIVGYLDTRLVGAFERIEPQVEVVYVPGGIPISGWTVWVCHGFRGFAPGTGSPTDPDY